MNTLVEMKNVTKVFPGVTALKDISFSIKGGEVHVLLGENGAGKSTLMKILSGVYQPTEGSIVIGDKEFSSLTPKDSYENGISIIYQELSVINELSIEENLFVGKLPSKSILGLSVVDRKDIRQKANELLKKIGLNRNPDTLVGDISISEKQQVEIAKALAANAQVIIMDEPTTSLTIEETKHLFNIVNTLKKEGKGIVFISHKLKEIYEIGDIVTVLKDGTSVGTKNVSEVEVDDLVKMMVGRTVKATYQHEEDIDFSKEEVLFEVKNITRKDNKVKNVSFKVHKGEIVGFSGLVGAGRTELMDAIFGAKPKASGKVYYKGKKISTKSPYYAIKKGIALVTENRREAGFFDNFDIKENISILPFIKTSKLGGLWGLLNFKNEKKWATKQRESLRIKSASIEQNITELSGGNQQKVILGKWLAADSQVIIFDEPTKGIDVGSKSEIYTLIRQLADDGKTIIVVSSDMPELLAVCDTIIVFKQGQIVKTFNYKEASEESILRASTGEINNGVNSDVE